MYLPHGKYITAEFHIRRLLRQSILRVITRKIYISLIIYTHTYIYEIIVIEPTVAIVSWCMQVKSMVYTLNVNSALCQLYLKKLEN